MICAKIACYSGSLLECSQENVKCLITKFPDAPFHGLKSFRSNTAKHFTTKPPCAVLCWHHRFEVPSAAPFEKISQKCSSNFLSLYAECPRRIKRIHKKCKCAYCQNEIILTIILLMWRIWWVPNNASKWQMGFNPLNPELNPIYYLLALLGTHHFLQVCRIRVKSLTLRLLMSYIYIWSTHSWCF